MELTGRASTSFRRTTKSWGPADRPPAEPSGSSGLARCFDSGRHRPSLERTIPLADSRTMRPAPEDLKAKALEIHRRLCGAFGCPIPYFHALDPVSELVSSLLSHRTRNADSGRAFKALRARYPTWEALCEAPTAEVQETIAGVTWPELKAPRIQAILRAIAERRGALSLDFLSDMPVAGPVRGSKASPALGRKRAQRSSASACCAKLRFRSTATTIASRSARVLFQSPWTWARPMRRSQRCCRRIGMRRPSTTTMKSLCCTASDAVSFATRPAGVACCSTCARPASA
jgi:hypothetical protein